MAKSARSSTTKTNNAALRNRVFRPVDEARTQRLSAKLMELAAQPKPERPEAMEIESEPKARPQKDAQDRDSEEMDIDGGTENQKRASKTSSSKPSNRVQKKSSRRKTKSAVTFASSKKLKGKESGKKSKARKS